jgi:hypothetical protein
LTGSPLNHIREQLAAHSLCGHSCDWMAGWSTREDWHPEDVDQDQRCMRCYVVLEARKRHERGERAPRRSKGAARKLAVDVKRKANAETVKRAVAARDERLAQDNERIRNTILEAQAAGSSMQSIADALGFSRQALYKFMGR